MTPEQFTTILEAVKTQVNDSVKPAIDTAVNGKVNGLRAELQSYIVIDTEWKKHDKEWKDDAQPVIDMGKDIQAGNRILAWVAGTIAALGAVWAAFKFLLLQHWKL